MSRKRRIIYPRQCYHVMVRGVNGQHIFNDERDRVHFCYLLEEASKKHAFDVHGFCLMGNHVHLLLQPHTEDLSSGMHFLSFRYAQFFNKKLQRRGHLFQDRYKAILVQYGAHLCRVIRYIHRNPIRANLVKDLSSHPWSSYHAYIGNSKLSWLTTDFVLPLFGSDSVEALASFRKYIYLDDADAKSELIEIRNSKRIGAYGNDLFVEEFKSSFESNSMMNKSDQTEINLEMLLNAVQSATLRSLGDLQSTCRSTRFVDARALFIWLALRFKLSTRGELTLLLNRKPDSISRLHWRANQSPKLRQLAAEIVDKISSHKLPCQS